MTTPLDPITITVVGVLLVFFVPIVGLLFGLIALAQGNMVAAAVFLALWLAGGIWSDD